MAYDDVHARCHVWAPELHSTTGGIQTFSRYFVDAFRRIEEGNLLRLVLKNDPPQRNTVGTYSPFVHCCGTWPHPLRTPRFAIECLNWARVDRPKLIVSTHLNFGPLAYLARSITKGKYILVAHGIDAWNLDDRARIYTLREADRIFAVSRFTQDSLILKFGVRSERIKILPNTFSPERFTPSPKCQKLLRKYGFSADTPVILTVGRLAGSERYKGYDQILYALPSILKAVPTARYLLVGSGPDRERLEVLATELGVRASVVFAGFVSDDDLCAHYNLCNIFAMPSKAEGFGIVYLEALACGKPVLAGNKDGSCDALADGDLGLLVDPDNVNEIATEIISVLRGENGHLKIFRAEYLRRRVIELFGLDAFSQTLEEHLSPLL